MHVDLTMIHLLLSFSIHLAIFEPIGSINALRRCTRFSFDVQKLQTVVAQQPREYNLPSECPIIVEWHLLGRAAEYLYGNFFASLRFSQ